MELHTHKGISKKKAEKILRDGMIRRKKLSAKQKKFFDLMAGGRIPKRRKRIKVKGRKRNKK